MTFKGLKSLIIVSQVGGNRIKMDYIDVREAAKIWGILERRVTALCRMGKIVGAKKEGKLWLIPKGTKCPPDGRTKEAHILDEKKRRGESRFMGKYFGTDGFRGKAGVVLTAEHAFLTGRFLGWYYGKEHKARIVIGKDTRRSSYMFEAALSAGITSSGGRAHLLHVTTTPCVSYITRTENFDCGIMISASHNPYFDNGIKLMNADGEKMEEEVLNLIEQFIDGEFEEEIPWATDENIGETIDFYSGRNRYIGYLTGIASHSFENCKIALDCANGSTWMIAQAVFTALGAKCYVINNTPNGTNINMNAGSTHMEGLQKYVRDNHLDVGFAFDGDGDRCLAVDEYGDVINGDSILYVCGKQMKNKGLLPKDTIVTTVMSNFGLYKAFDKIGIKYEKTDVGDKYVYENMKKNNYLLGGEQSGHVIFRKYAHTGDGLVTAIMMMEVLVETQLPLSVLASEVVMYPQVLKNVEVDDKDSTLADKAVIEAVEASAKALGSDGRVLLRKSGTEPVLRVMAEAATYKDCEKYVDLIIDSMKKSGHLQKIR